MKVDSAVAGLFRSAHSRIPYSMACVATLLSAKPAKSNALFVEQEFIECRVCSSPPPLIRFSYEIMKMLYTYKVLYHLLLFLLHCLLLICERGVGDKVY